MKDPIILPGDVRSVRPGEPVSYPPAMPDELRDMMLARKMDVSSVDFEKLAAAINDRSSLVTGWSPPKMGPEWRETERNLDTARYVSARRRLTVILSCSVELDTRAWLHLSVSHAERVPTHGEMKTVKLEFLGDRYAYAVWPPKARYVNLNANVLHLFSLLDEHAEQPLPDFTAGTGSI